MIPLEFVKTLGIPISRLTMEEVICLVEEWLVSKAGKKRIVTVNPEFLVLSYYNREFESILRKADLAVPDGVGILTAAQYSFYMRSLPNSKLLCLAGSFFYGIVCGLALLFCPAFFKVLKERITGVDLVGNLCQKSREQGWRVFLLGGWFGVGAQTAANLRAKYPGLILNHFQGSPDCRSETRSELDKTLQIISNFNPDILLVAYGFPAQEYWISSNFESIPCRLVIGVGGTLDMLSGRVRRAPYFFRRLGLEWLWRLLLEPGRFTRIFRAVVVFPYLVWRSNLLEDKKITPFKVNS
ncbi:hypothetical protein COT52_01205 [candidate division WWE3 bacterium CG08_land_8_20_14_0_20_43_13]|uniref:Glycosyltransferase n=1 Tax=candidate division WWE3 bacterium CG08_land_8_20_14_0_20_43_13 TaxID=1975087 RepID=A0A2H0XA21_UNCKA|nr:MAG: hypothetical protein COT52_01205 [candidate division WWE3 bacterium CG08_land_8_20_14_0_20_43_13]